MERTVAAAKSELPLACTLDQEDGPARMLRWRALAERAGPVARRSGHRLEVRYEPEPGVLEELSALAAAERECCGFVTWEVGRDGAHLVLRVTADPNAPDDVAPIAALFGAGTVARWRGD